jgi:hypothetical protein
MVYAYFFVGTSILFAVGKVLLHTIRNIIHMALEPICEDLTKIKYQLYNNGGESMKDAIDRIERDAIELKINQAVIKAKVENK